jgi:hypothetical protein
MGNGDGTFQEAVITRPSFAVFTIGVGDFNGDGKLDLATAGQFGTQKYVNILLGNGDGKFHRGASYPGEGSPASIAIADFNGDGELDMAIANSQGIGVRVWMGNGDGTFQRGADYPTAFPTWVIAADLNGDGKIDLAAANFLFSSGATVFLGNGDGTFQAGTFYSASDEPRSLAVGDFNGAHRLSSGRYRRVTQYWYGQLFSHDSNGLSRPISEFRQPTADSHADERGSNSFEHFFHLRQRTVSRRRHLRQERGGRGQL